MVQFLTAAIRAARFNGLDPAADHVRAAISENRSFGPNWAVDLRVPVLLDTPFQKEHHRLYTRGELVRLATTLNNPLNS